MKLFTQLAIFALVLTQCSISVYAQQTVEPTGSELWQRVISYHDPDNRWDDFKGRVHLVTTFSDGTFVQEEIFLSKQDRLYHTTRLDGQVRAVKGVEGDDCFARMNGDSTPTEEEISMYNLSCEAAHLYKQHHSAHFGLPMELMTSGVVVDPEVRKTAFFGSTVYALELIGESDAVKHDYYSGTWTLYVDPETYQLRGYAHQGDDLDVSCTAVGELEIYGIRMPQVKTCYQPGDTFWFVDTFSYVND